MNTQEQLTEDDPGHGVKRYAFDATRGEMFEVASGAYVSVDDLDAANARAEKAERRADELAEALSQFDPDGEGPSNGALDEAMVAGLGASRLNAEVRAERAESEAADLRSLWRRSFRAWRRAEKENDELRAALTAANARIAQQRDVIKEHCAAMHERASELAAANARAEAAERDAREADAEVDLWKEKTVQQKNRADAAERARGRALAICEEREQMLKAVESEAAALRAEVERLRGVAGQPATSIIVQTGAGPVEVTAERRDAMNRARAAVGMPPVTELELSPEVCEACDELGRACDGGDHCDNCGKRMDGDIAATADVCFDCWRAAKERTAAEQAVLDAMAAWPVADLRDPFDAPPPSQRAYQWRCLIELCRAELARRGLKP